MESSHQTVDDSQRLYLADLKKNATRRHVKKRPLGTASLQQAHTPVKLVSAGTADSSAVLAAVRFSVIYNDASPILT